MADELEKLRNQLETVSEEKEFLRLQGEIKRLKWFLNLPERIGRMPDDRTRR